ncbi:uncharacterized protein LOC117642912 [Thrips palmi]|uniref:Gustatory receptor n=1 Tax=Thrips palmi TaxID=161013 RepID=A0A6P8YKZ6_THRPL|nr:uncharacterized protein LOC117642912 [Thrips palmi]
MGTRSQGKSGKFDFGQGKFEKFVKAQCVWRDCCPCHRNVLAVSPLVFVIVTQITRQGARVLGLGTSLQVDGNWPHVAVLKVLQCGSVVDDIMDVVQTAVFFLAARNLASVFAGLRAGVDELLAAGEEGAEGGDVAQKIRRLRDAHKQICILVADLSACFGPSLVASLMLHLWSCVFSFSNITRVLHSGLPWTVLVGVINFLSTVSPPMLLMQAAYQIDQQGNSALPIVHQLINRDSDKPAIRRELSLFADQLTQDRVCVRLLGVVKVGHSLAFKALGIITTYIVIVMQFQGSNSRHAHNGTEPHDRLLAYY